MIFCGGFLIVGVFLNSVYSYIPLKDGVPLLGEEQFLTRLSARSVETKNSTDGARDGGKKDGEVVNENEDGSGEPVIETELLLTSTSPTNTPSTSTQVLIASPSTRKPMKCFDVSPKCHKLKHLCQSSYYRLMMTKTCAKTCGFCKDFVNLQPVPKCRDTFRRSCLLTQYFFLIYQFLHNRMIVIVGNAYQIWLPIYTIQDGTYSSGIYSFLIVLELILTVVSVVLTIWTIYVILRSGAFHRNMNGLLIFFLASWIESLISKLCFIPYSTGYLTVGEQNHTADFIWTDDIDEMLIIDNVHDYILIFVGGFIRWYYLFTMTTCLLFLAIERSCASYFLNDYEKTRRSYILYSMIISHQIVTCTLSYFCYFNEMPITLAICFSSCLNFFAFCAHAFNRFYNLRISRQFENITNKSAYSLAARFQANENNRSHELTVRLISCSFVLVLVSILILVINFSELFPESNTFLAYSFENVVHLNPLVICPILLLSLTAWNRNSTNCDENGTKWSQDTVETPTAEKNNKETDAYFDQFRNAWQ